MDRGYPGSTSGPGRHQSGSDGQRFRPAVPGLTLGSEGLRGRPDVFGDSGTVLRADWVDQVSRATRDHSRGTGIPTDVPGDSGPAPSACGVNQPSRATCILVREPLVLSSCPRGLGSMSVGLRGRPAVPRDSCPYPMSSGVHQGTRATRARVCRTAVSTSTPWRHAHVSEGLRGRPAVPGTSRSGSRTREVDPISLATWARFRGPAG